MKAGLNFMGITVHLVDASRTSDAARFEQLSDKHKGDIVIKLGPMCDGLAQAASDIRSATSKGSIDLLIIYGHGTSAFQGISMGNGDEPGGRGGLTGYENRAGIGPNQLGQDKDATDHFSNAWRPLREHFSSAGEIILKGCRTGGGKDGEEFLRRLAKTMGVPVKASDWSQITGRSKLVGNIKTAHPSGTLTEDKGEGLKALQSLPLSERLILSVFGRPK